MRVFYIAQYFLPERIAPAYRASETAEQWGKSGVDVTVFTGYPNYPTGKIFDGYKPKLLQEENKNGIRILRSKLIAKNNNTIVGRLINACSFFFFALVNIAFQSKRMQNNYDVILATSGPIFSALLGPILAKKWRCPLIVEFRDITFKQMIATGASSHAISVQIMRALEMFICKRANSIVTVTEGFKAELSSEGIRPEKISVITNGVDILEAHDIFFSQNDSLCISYFGTLGISQCVENTVPYVRALLQHIRSLSYLIVGDGARKNEMVCACECLPFVQLLPSMSIQNLEEYYGQTQLSIVTLRKSDSFGATIPSKLFQIMGRGIPVLFIGPEGEAASIVRKFDAGICLTGDFDTDVHDLGRFFSDANWQERLIEMGRNGQAAVKEHYSRTALANKYLLLLEQVAEAKVNA